MPVWLSLSFAAGRDRCPALDEAAYARALQRIRAEYLEMPGMQLTALQVQRLAGVNALACARVLEEIVMTGVLRRAIDGTSCRPTGL